MIVLIVCVGVTVSQYCVLSKVKQVVKAVEIKEEGMQTTWMSGGIEIKVTSTQNPGETNAEWQARHDEMVAKIKEVAPEDK